MNKLVLNFKALFVIALGVMVLASCSEDEEIVQPADLVGAWAVESTSVEVMVGEQTMTQYITEELELSGVEAELMAELMTVAFEEELAGTIELNDDNTYISSIGDDTEETGTWALSTDGKQLTLTPEIGDDVITLDVVSANGNTLTLALAEEMEEDLNEDGTAETLVVNMTINLTK